MVKLCNQYLIGFTALLRPLTKSRQNIMIQKDTLLNLAINCLDNGSRYTYFTMRKLGLEGGFFSGGGSSTLSS